MRATSAGSSRSANAHPATTLIALQRWREP